MRDAGVPATEIEMYYFRRGYEAKNCDKLAAAVRKSHIETFGSEPPAPNSPTCSMWRDINIFNEVGVPAITYGPRSESHSFKRSFTIDALYKAACVYARTILSLCNQEKPAP